MIEIPSSIVRRIIERSRECLPEEACGLLTGSGDRIEGFHALTNTDHSPEHFSFDPQEQFAVLNQCRREGRKIIANWHSHPETPARPSEEDKRLAYDPGILYFILSLAEEEPVLKAFRIINGESEPVGIIVAEDR